MRRAFALVLAAGIVGVGPRVALARRGVRPLFEPTDLELEEAGIVEADLQVGALRAPAPGPWRAIVPDLELDVGLLRRLELDVDFAFAIEEATPGSGASARAAPENAWVAAKMGLWDWADDDLPGSPVAWALGAQAGPRFPVAPDAHGLGFEGLALLGHLEGRAHFVLNLGAFVDPGPTAGGVRPSGVEGGLDVDCDLDRGGHASITAELAGVRFFSNDPDQLSATAGFAWSPTPATELNVLGLYGLLGGSDRYGVLFGISQKLRLWNGP
jgi:hypothetical protein